jgi:hypothetical protein
VFPYLKRVTVENLSQFVLANLQAESRLHALLGLHGGSPQARLHTIAALHEVLIQRRKVRATKGKHKNCVLIYYSFLKCASIYDKRLVIQENPRQNIKNFSACKI